MARTYLERHLDEFAGCDREGLVKHGLRALKESLSQDKELNVENTSVGVIGMGTDGKRKIESFRLYDGPEIGPLLDASLESTQGAAETETGPEGVEGETMDVDS